MRSQEESRKITALLLDKVKDGRIRKDILKNDAFPLEAEMEAIYFANCRNFIRTKNAYLIMNYR